MLDSHARVVQGLGKVVDDQISWLSQWHQVAFYGGQERQARATALKSPPSFSYWMDQAKLVLHSQYGVLKRLHELHDQLHTSARLVIMATPEGEALAINDYETVLNRFDAFVTTLRRLERAFSSSAAGMDPLTGLRTRSGLEEDFNREMNRLKNAKTPFIGVMVDPDHFREIQENHGHDSHGNATGDRVLTALANGLLRHIRTYDDAYRFGNEKFFLLLKGLDSQTAMPVLERLRSNIAALEVVADNGKTIRLTASFGFAQTGEGDTLDMLLAKTEKALAHAKQAGGDTVVAD